MLVGGAPSDMPRLLLPLLLLCSVVASQSPDLRSRIRQSVEAGNHDAAVSELRELAERDPRSFTAENYDYLLGRSCERTGDVACAAASFASVAARDSVLRGYAIWHLSELSRSSGNLLAERTYLLRLLAERPGSLLAEAADKRLARSWFESGNFTAAIKELSRGGAGKGPVDRGEQVLLAKAYLFNNDHAGARTIFASLVNSGANPSQPDDHALEAARGLDLLDVGRSRFGKEVGSLSDWDHLRRAQIYQFNRDFPAARLHYTAILERHPQSGIVPDAIYQIGRVFAQSSEFAEAAKWYERAIEQFPDNPVAKDALLQLASAYARLGKYRVAVARYERFISLYPEDERLDRAYLNIIDVLRDAGEETEALTWAAKTQDAFQGKAAEAQALFSQARMRIARNDWQTALADLNKLTTLRDLGGADAPGGTTREEVDLLRAYTLEQLRRFPDAVDIYLSIPDGRNAYYGWRSTERLRSLSADAEAKRAVEAKLAQLSAADAKIPDERRRNLQSMVRLSSDANPRVKLLDDLRTVYASIPAYRAPTAFKSSEALTSKSGSGSIADELASLGLYDEAAVEKEAVLGKAPSPDAAYLLANWYLNGDRADRAAAFIESQPKLPADFQVELLPPQFTGMLYPAPYKDDLLRHASPRGVDPHFLLSIMRQESRFRPNVKSNAAARGLMQFISTTADRIAVDLGRTGFQQDELFHPPTAILFGSKYLADLFGLYPGMPDAVAASYNGGEDNMKRWLARSKSYEPDRYVPEIQFAQSKDYVQRVMANYRMYTLLYDERLNRR
jgi:soluble lytic murein transglycosylase